MALPRRQRVAAYAVIVRDERILLSRLAPWITANEQWTLPGGGLDHGEDPRDAVVREIREETGLDAVVGEQARVYSAHQARVRRDGRRSDYHALRIVYDAWVPPDSPDPRVVEVDGSTIDSAWHPLADVLDGTVPTVPMVQQALADWSPYRMQRVGAYALVRAATHRRGATCCWCASRPGASTPARGACRVAASTTASGRPPRWCARSRRSAASRPRSVSCCWCTTSTSAGPRRRAATRTSTPWHWCSPRLCPTTPSRTCVEVGGTTDQVAWVPLREVTDGSRQVLDVVHEALNAAAQR